MKLSGILFFLSLAFSILLFLPYSARVATDLPNVIDPLFYAWNFSHNTRAIMASGRHLLDTNIFYPQTNTLAYSDTLMGQMPFVLPVILLTGNPVLAENIAILLTFPIACVAMYLLAHSLTRNRIASAAAGLFFAFSYPRLSQLGHIPALSSQWLPLILLFLIRFLKHGKTPDLLLTFFWYAVSLNSTVYFGVFATLPVFAITLWKFVQAVKDRAGRAFLLRLKPLFVWGIPFLLIIGLSLFPYIRLKAEYPEITRRVEDIQYLQAHLIDYVTVLPSSFMATLGFPARNDEHVLYPTLTLLVLASIGLITRKKTKAEYAVIFAFIGLAAFILSLGTQREFLFNGSPITIYLPYYYLYFLFPPLQIVRVPARLSIIVILALSMLAAYGFTYLTKHKRFRIAVLASILLFLLEIGQWHTPSVTIPTGNGIPRVYRWLETIPDTAIIAELPLREWRYAGSMEDQLMLDYASLRESHGYALETYRIYFSSFHGKRMVNGYSSYFPQVYHDTAALTARFPAPESLDRLLKLGVRYIIVHAWQYDPSSWETVSEAIRGRPELREIQRFGDDIVFELISPV